MKLLALIAGLALMAPQALADGLPDSIPPGPALSLADAIKMADERNVNLQASRIDLQKAQADLKYAWSTLLPVASGSLSFTHNDHADTANLGGQSIVTRKQDDFRGNLLVNLPLVNARAWVGIGAADIYEDVAALTVEGVRQQLLQTVVQTYFAGLTALNLIQVQREQIQASSRHLEIANLRHRMGTGRRLDVVRIRTELVRAKDDLVASLTLLDNTRYALASLLAMEEKPMPIAISEPEPPPDDEKKLLGLALEQREDLKLRHALTRLSDENLTGNWMAFVPSLNATWQLNQQITDPSDFSDVDKGRWFIGLTLNVPLYDHTRYAELDQARADLTKNELLEQDAKRQAILQVRQARGDWHKSGALAVSALERATLAAETLKLAEAAYVNGSGSSLDVTDAQRTNNQAAIDLTIKRFDAQLALLALMRTVGQDMSKLLPGEAS
jgi:outer membrane protein TolC